jgi:outer membrane receptor protein involved in Fe transport
MKASGKLENLSTGVGRNFQTDEQGSYVFQDLTPGRYRLEVTQEGFATQSLAVNVSSGSPVSRSVTLEVARTALSKIDVVGTTPLPGVDLPTEEVAASVQTASQADVERSGAFDLPDFMNRRLNGVHLNEMQGNPFQTDLNFRGYTASPLLGTAQGISVYMDGVRQNQSFGDVVSWDLIQNNAISSMTLISGSDPLFGLNTLGGALSIQSKDGLSNPGLGGRLIYGSSGRKALEAEMGGGKATGLNWYFASNAFHESGWRFDSPSDIRQGFARLGWKQGTTDLALTSGYSYNTLTGNGVQDYRLLAADYSSIYTLPDTIGNRSPFVNLSVRHTLGTALTFAGNAYFRNIRSEVINGNLNPNSLDESVYQPTAADQAALKAAGYTGYPASGANASNTPFPFWRCIAQGLLHSEAIEKCNAVNVFTKSVQNNYGLSGQTTWLGTHGSGHNQLTAGAAFDRSTVGFTQNTQFGYLNPDRSITGINAWEDGSTNSNGDPVDTRINLHGVNRTASIYVLDTLALGSAWHLTFSGRYNHNTVSNLDRISPGGGPGSLDGHNTFERFNPSAGITYSPTIALNAYASYTEGSRAPSSIELGCADPLNPCSLPNALASDPPLRQVVTGTWEAGIRGRMERDTRWNVGAFHAENRNDILFVSSQQTGSGYFKNFGKTLRQGIDASIDGRIHKISAGIDYTFLQATYQSVETVDGSGNNTSDTALAGLPGLEGTITVHQGNRIPLVPAHTGKAFLDFQPTSKFLLDVGLITASSSYARGNEDNSYKADGKYYMGPGVSPGYAVVNFAAHYDVTRHFQLAVTIDNVLDRHYYTAALLTSTGFTPQATFIARPFPAYATGDFPVQHATFFAPGAPRRLWLELRVKF